jgi:formylglycine-generating enzyme required for sulfatase activity
VAYEYNIGKYEVTAGQYAAFLNALPRSQCGQTGILADNSCRYYAPPPPRHRYSLQGDWPNIAAATPQVACNFLSWGDGTSYAAWAGLRPMSELEYEKACRGPLKPVPNEFAWGTAAIADARYELVPGSAGTAAERVTPNTLSQTAGNAVYGSTRPDFGPGAAYPWTDDQLGPLRVGIFETDAGLRKAAQASVRANIAGSDGGAPAWVSGSRTVRASIPRLSLP